MNAPVILSLGSINVDLQVRIDRRPELGETVLGRDFARLGGGKAANVAFLARRLEVGAQLLARVGDDDLREYALAPLREIGGDLSYVSAVKGGFTGVSLIAVPPDGNKAIILAANANQSWTREDADEIASAVESAAAGSVLVVDYEVPGFVVEQAVGAASRCRLPVILDPSPADRVEDAILSCINVIVPNASEASKLTHIAIEDVEAASSAGRILVERGVRAACVKLADGGCVLVQQQHTIHIPPLPVEVVDATGAGDAFAGALAVALLEQRPMLQAACFATAAAHLAVADYGSQPAYPTREQTSRRLSGPHVAGSCPRAAFVNQSRRSRCWTGALVQTARVLWPAQPEQLGAGAFEQRRLPHRDRRRGYIYFASSARTPGQACRRSPPLLLSVALARS